MDITGMALSITAVLAALGAMGKALQWGYSRVKKFDTLVETINTNLVVGNGGSTLIDKVNKLGEKVDDNGERIGAIELTTNDLIRNSEKDREERLLRQKDWDHYRERSEDHRLKVQARLGILEDAHHDMQDAQSHLQEDQEKLQEAQGRLQSAQQALQQAQEDLAHFLEEVDGETEDQAS